MKFGEEAPFGRPGQPAEIAPLYVTLASAETSFTSGRLVLRRRHRYLLI